ncbi:MAG: hypothetical protein ABR986_07415 [Methanomassiliicoccales archaeon]
MNRKKIGVTLLVCAILASGLIAAGMVATNGIATDGSSDVSVDSATLTKTLNVTVYADFQGQTVPIQGANVTVYEVTVVQNDTVETITIEKIAVSTTGVGGVAQIILPEGNYTIVADYYGLRSVGVLSNDTTEKITMVLNAESCGHGEHSISLTNQTAEYTLPDMNGILANGDAGCSERGMPRRH